jgi:two-component system KDP operon response regulator KdpE
LIVDADDAGAQRTAGALLREGYSPRRTASGQEGLAHLRDAPPDAMLLDLDLPDLDGRHVLTSARRFYHRPVLILTARTCMADKIEALDLGADDVLEKSCHADELLARLRVADRNKLTREGAPLVLRSEGVEIDMRRRMVRREEAEVHLSTREYNLLVELAKSAGRVVTHRQLLTAVWGPDRADHVEYLRVYVQQLRQKLEQDPTSPKLILTETGVGYRLVGRT